MATNMQPAPNLTRLLPIELPIALLIITVCQGAILAGSSARRDLVRSAEAVTLSFAARLAGAERYAVDGVVAPDASTSLFRHGPSTPGFDLVRTETGTLARGAPPFLRRPVALNFYSSVRADGPSYTVLWLCNEMPPPPGWTTEPIAADTPPETSFAFPTCHR